MYPSGAVEVAEGIYFKKGKQSGFKKNKAEEKRKKEYDTYEQLIDESLESSIAKCSTSDMRDDLIDALFDADNKELIKVAFLSSEGFQPKRMYDHLKKVLPKNKNIKFYESQPTIFNLVNDVGSPSKQFVGIFDISENFKRSFFHKFIDSMEEAGYSAVLFFISQYPFANDVDIEEVFGVPTYTSKIYDPEVFVKELTQSLASELSNIKQLIDREIEYFMEDHRSEKQLSLRLKYQAVKLVFRHDDKKLIPHATHSDIFKFTTDGMEDYVTLYDIISELAYKHEPIGYTSILDAFAAVIDPENLPKEVQCFSLEYYFRIILDTFERLGVIVRRPENPEVMSFYPKSDFDLILSNMLTE